MPSRIWRTQIAKHAIDEKTKSEFTAVRNTVKTNKKATMTSVCEYIVETRNFAMSENFRATSQMYHTSRRYLISFARFLGRRHLLPN